MSGEIQDWIQEENQQKRNNKKSNKKKPVILIVLLLVLVAVIAVLGILIAQGGSKAKKSEKKVSKPVSVETQTEEISEKKPVKTTEIQETEETQESTQSDLPKGYTKEEGDVWTTDMINFREKDDLDGEVLAVIPANTKLESVAVGEKWTMVRYEEKTGYVSSEYLTAEEPKQKTPGEYATGGGNGQGQIIVLDAGHQANGDSTQEPNGPGSSTMKARVTGGTCGTTTGVYEYQLNLAIAQQLETELTSRGYKVYMTRTSHDVNISNKERAEYATSVNADICIRIHANGSDNSGANGAMALSPSASNPYVANLAKDSQRLGECVLNSYCAATGMKNGGVVGSDNMTGINWCTMPVTIIEMGYMTNPSDDTNMEDAQYQANMVQGIANGVDQYFQ